MSYMHLPYWLAATYLPGIGPRTLLRLLDHFSDITTLFHATADDLRAIGLSEKQILALKQPDWQAVESDLAWLQIAGNHIIAFSDPDYPALLKEISDPPLVLYVRGDKSVLTKMQIAMVGARNATPTGLKNAEWFAKSLAQAGCVITSGLAAGVDAAAHRGALAVGQITIGVAGTGLNHIYPRSHHALVEDICKKGAVISEFSLDTKPHAANFPRRNRIIAGMSVGTLVVEAAVKSGSLITARHAIEHGRDVFAIPGSIHNPLARGCHHLIRQGAKLVETANDILEELGALTSAFIPQDEPQSAPALLLKESQLLEKIEYEITPIDMIILHSGLTAGEVSSILLSLELHGYVKSVPGGYVRVALSQ